MHIHTHKRTHTDTHTNVNRHVWGCKVMSRGFSNYERTVCQKKREKNGQTCRQEHTDPHAQQIHTGAASRKSFSCSLRHVRYIGYFSRLCHSLVYVILSVKDKLDDFSLCVPIFGQGYFCAMGYRWDFNKDQGQRKGLVQGYKCAVLISVKDKLAFC